MKTTFGQRCLSLFLTLVLCLTLVPSALADDPAYQLTLDKTTLALTVGGASGKLTATITAGNGGTVPAGAKAEWKSDTPSVATVDGDGNVTAAAAGTAKITAEYTDTATGTVYRSDACTVTVSAAAAAPTGLEVKFAGGVTELDMVARDKETLAAIVTALPAGSAITESRLSYEWSTSNSSVVSVSKNGSSATILAEGAGEAVVTLTVRYPSTPALSAIATCRVYVSPKMNGVSLNSYSGTIDVNKQVEVVATPNPDTEIVKWESSDSDVATVGTTDASGRRAVVYGRKPGKAIITATIGSAGNMEKAEYSVTVSGLVIEQTTMSVRENETELLPIVNRYGAAANGTLSWQSSNPSVAQISGSSVAGRGPGIATITAYAGTYEASFNVSVDSDEATTIEAGSIQASERLNFGDFLSKIAAQAPGGLSHVTGLSVSPAHGTLYYKYTSPDEPNEGVAQNGSYYYSPGTGQRGIADISFVPNPQFSGGTATISYTVVSKTNQNYSCRILVEVVPNKDTDISLTATNYDPAWFSGDQFNKICQRETGSGLDYVVFSLPPARQGTLYFDYKSVSDYGGTVTAGTQYRRGDLDSIVFVPAAGFTGTATVYYTGRSVGTRGSSYSGRVQINVTRENVSGNDGPYYNVSRGGSVSFDDTDFNNYCRRVLSGNPTLNHIQFDAVPSSSQGTLYYNYRSASNTGGQVNTGDNYYYGTRNPRIDRITFVPEEGFSGTVRLPFTGWDDDGHRFTGTVEINVRGGGGSGDIRYTCAPGRTVDLVLNDFKDLCSDLTDRTLNYIVFQDLPDRSSEGSLYHSNSRVTATGTRYYNSSGSYRINRLSFQASSSFSGEVDIPFIGYASNGDTFNGVLTIESVSTGDSENIYYSATSKEPAKFDRDDFDELSQWETQRNVSSVKFEVPSTSRGDLYRGYRSTSSKGTRITSNTTSISASALDQVAFIPAAGFTGTVYIDFTATAASNGGTFTGTVEITVERPGADVTVRYSTKTAPVDFRGEDFKRSGYTLNSIQFGALPSSSEGHLYFHYTSPTQYDRQASTGSVYRTSGSNLISDLTFVPKAGFTGTVTIPYTGTNSNKSTFEGEVVITVSATNHSAYFTDMSDYSDQQRAAVDYLYDSGITVGVSYGRYAPEQSISRGEFAVMVYKAFGFAPATSGRFTDVPYNAYYAEAVNALHFVGVVSGVGNGAFAPNAKVSRQDAVCMVQRAMRAVGWSTSDSYTTLLSNYSDGGNVSSYAKGPVSYAVAMGYLPMSGSQLRPLADLTRVDMAVFLHRVLTY